MGDSRFTLGSLRDVLPKFLVDLVDASPLLKSYLAGDSRLSSFSESTSTDASSSVDENVARHPESGQHDDGEHAPCPAAQRPQLPTSNSSHKNNAPCRITSTSSVTTQGVATPENNSGNCQYDRARSRHDLKPLTTFLASHTDIMHDVLHRANKSAPLQALATTATNASKSYETISLHGSSAIFGDVHYCGGSGDLSIIRFEDCLGRLHKIPYEKCRTWNQMQSLIYKALPPSDELLAHIVQGRYHLTGPDREIILPEYWDHVVTPGISINMKVWPTPALEALAASTLPVGLRTVGAFRFDEYQLSVPSSFSQTSGPVYNQEKKLLGDINQDVNGVSCEAEGYSAFMAEDYVTAIVKFGEAMHNDPSNITLYLSRARAYLAMESLEEALRDCVQATTLNERCAPAWILKGSILKVLQQHENALDSFQKARTIDPTNLRARKEVNLLKKNMHIISNDMSDSKGGTSMCAQQSFEAEISSSGTNNDTQDRSHDVSFSQYSQSVSTSISAHSTFYRQNLPEVVHFEHVRNLGAGSYGNVDCVREMTTGTLYAKKTIHSMQGTIQMERMIQNEAKIMSELRHQHISGTLMFYKNTSSWSLLMLPVADYSLGYFLEEEGDQSAPNRAVLDQWFGCLISALAYVHAEGVRHGDIKPNNILIKGRKVYLTDFGTAEDFSSSETSNSAEPIVQGTPIYFPPESLPWGQPADIFALGCVFAEMLTVRQSKSLFEFREWRYNPQMYNHAYKNNLGQVKSWLKMQVKIKSDSLKITILQKQIFEMLKELPSSRTTAARVRRSLREDTNQFFCNSCA